MSPITPDVQSFREVFGAWTSGVAVITANGAEGPAGMTANAVCSLSLRPLLLLVCFDNAARTLPIVRETRRFAVNVLAAGQDGLAREFASKAAHRDSFASVAWSSEAQLPVLDGVVAWIACGLEQLIPGGDHTIAIGAVEALEHDSAAQPLVWHRGTYVETT
jgi:flavin reductase (DIM6/NTAB) family NADH-FMN oxidoreductase RutF